MADDWFPFSISPLEEEHPGLLDLTALNELPAGKAGFVKVVGAHFQDGRGEPLRFFGTNVVAAGCFPSKEDAPKLARHLAKLGHNIIRFHFLDNQWGGDSLLQAPDYQTYNAEALDRLHFFLNELNKVGIYINLNLHVGRTYEGSPKEGPDMSKGVDLFHEPYSKAFQEYARHLLSTKNPYRQLAPAEDPGVAVIELNNENTLLMNPWWLNRMGEPFASEFLKLWNAWLRKEYGTAEALVKSYGLREGQPGPNLLTKPIAPEGTDSAWRRDDPAPEHSKLSALPALQRGVRWEILQSGEKPWSHQLICAPLPLQDGTGYELSFKARADQGRNLQVAYMLNEGDYANAGLQFKAALTAEWQTFTTTFSPHHTDGRQARLSFDAVNLPGGLEIAELVLAVKPGGYLQSKTALEQGAVPFPEADAPLGVRRDAFRFLADTEMAWALKQKAFLKNELHVRQPISHSHVLFGGMLGARREAMVSDFVDNHGYWQHPGFPHQQWDMNDWDIGNTSQLVESQGGTLAEMAMQRPEGKPYCISEYDVPAPSDYAAESLPVLATFAAQQDWDAIYTFTFVNSPESWRGGKIGGFFDQSGHPAKHGFIPAAALIFRQSLVRPHSLQNLLTIAAADLMEDCTQSGGDIWGSWRRVRAQVRQEGSLALQMMTKLRVVEKGQAPEVFQQGRSEQPPFWQPEQGRYLMQSPAVAGAIGRISGTHRLGDVLLKIPPLEGNGHAAILLVSMDAQPLSTSKKMLLTALRRAENEGQQWNAARNSVGTQWGHAPARVLGLTATLSLRGAPVSIQPLGGNGQPTGAPLPASDPEMSISPLSGTIWYLLTRP